MLNKLSPFFAIIFSYFLLKEKIKPYQLICVIVAFIGALFILRPGFDSVATFPAYVPFRSLSGIRSRLRGGSLDPF